MFSIFGRTKAPQRGASRAMSNGNTAAFSGLWAFSWRVAVFKSPLGVTFSGLKT